MTVSQDKADANGSLSAPAGKDPAVKTTRTVVDVEKARTTSQTADGRERVGATPATGGIDLPSAMLKRERRLSWLWLLPLLAIGLVGWIGYQAWSQRGVVITIQLDRGHGLEPEADVRYRGITVGIVEAVELAEDLDGIVVKARLNREAKHLARAGARIWVVRPRLGIRGVAGLDTVVGPRYLAILPGEGPAQHRFVGLGGQPILEETAAGDLDVILESTRRGNLRPGSPVRYRQVAVGVIASVGLTADGGAVEARAHIFKAYAQLIRPSTKFWSAGGVEAKVGLRGLSVQLDSVESLVLGGVALATPPNGGEVVRTGHRFTLASEPQEEWLTWQPLVAIGSSLLPPGAPMAAPMRATLGGTKAGIFKSKRSYQGWVLQTDRGLLGPVELLKPNEKLDRASVVLEVAGNTVPLTADPIWSSGGLALLDAKVSDQIWPTHRRRTPKQPEDCLAIADPAATPLPLVPARLTSTPNGWTIDPAVAIDASWHGACVLAKSDGTLIGMILVADGTARVAPLAEGI